MLAALELVERGWRVTIVEASDTLGGLVRTERRDGLILDDGPDGIVFNSPAGLDLIRRLSLADEMVPSSPGRASILRGGRLHEVPAGSVLGVPTRLRPVLETRLLSVGDKVRLALDLVLLPRRSGVDESVGSLVRRRLGRGTAERLVGPLLGGIHAGDPDRLSALAAFPQLVEFERASGSLLRGARRAASSRRGDSPFVTPRGGMDRLVERLTDRLRPATIRTSAPALALSPRGAGYDVATADGSTRADLVVLAVAPAIAAGLLEAISPDASGELRGIRSASTAVVHLAYERKRIPALATGHGFVVPPVEGLSVTAVTDVSAKWPERAPAGVLLLRTYLGRDGSDPLVFSDSDLRELATADVARVLGLRAAPVLARVRRWPASMPQAEVGHLDRVAKIRGILGRDAPGVVVVGGGYDGVGIPAIAESVPRMIAKVATGDAGGRGPGRVRSTAQDREGVGAA